ncbi:MAG: NAD(P)H-dependent amine dehydrogenase family protein [Candidatus Hodarchaeales archaeon]|jgi:4-hydroxy-tetrahydrodipicolinate reductase
MQKNFNVVQIGFGAIGRLTTKLLMERENINLVGVVDTDPELQQKPLKDFFDFSKGSEIKIHSNMEKILAQNQIDVVIIITSSSLEKIAPIIFQAAKAGCNVISICEELSFPFNYFPKISSEIDSVAKKHNVSVVGTGINPGYLMDLLPIVLTAPCQTIQKISIRRMMNSAHRRIPFQKKIGTGLYVEEFRQKISKKEITGHVGLTQSIQMVMAALGRKYDEITEFPPEAVIAEKEIQTPFCSISKGQVCGLRSKAVAITNGVEMIELDFIAYAGEHDEFDQIVIEGTPRIQQKIEGGIHGDLGTVALIVNLIPKIFTAKAGLLTMKDLPVPCNTAEVWKENTVV